MCRPAATFCWRGTRSPAYGLPPTGLGASPDSGAEIHMSDPTIPTDVSFNGTDRTGEAGFASSNGGATAQGASAEERLDALMEAIRNWDWRASISTSTELASEVTTSANDVPAPVAAGELMEPPESFASPVKDVEPAPARGAMDTEHFGFERSPRHVRVESVPADSLEGQPDGIIPWTAPTPPPTPPPQELSETEAWPLPAPPITPSSSADVQDVADPATDQPPASSLSRIKVFALYFAAAVVVFLIIGAIRTFG